MHIDVVFSVDGSTTNDFYHCADASRQMLPGGLTFITFRNGPGLLQERGQELKVRTVTYQQAWRVLTWED